MKDEYDHVAPDAAQQYVAGTLPADEVAVFEQHLLTCAACRDEVRRGAAISAGLRARSSNATAPDARTRTRARVRWLVPATAVAAAAAIVVLVVSREDPAARLARLDLPPSFEPMPVRAPVAGSDRLIDSAMAAYVAGDFHRARRLLVQVPAGEAGTGGLFYFGAAALADRAPDVALAPLQRVVVDSMSPFAAPARVLLAKALLGVGRSDSALATLDRSRDASARAFADSIRALRPPSR